MVDILYHHDRGTLYNDLLECGVGPPPPAGYQPFPSTTIVLNTIAFNIIAVIFVDATRSHSISRSVSHQSVGPALERGRGSGFKFPVSWDQSSQFGRSVIYGANPRDGGLVRGSNPGSHDHSSMPDEAPKGQSRWFGCHARRFSLPSLPIGS